MNKYPLFSILMFSAILFASSTSGSVDLLPVPDAESSGTPSSFFDQPLLFQDVQGREVNLSAAAKGKITVLRFWSSFCPHSRSFDQPMQVMYNRFHPTVAMFDINSNWKIDVPLTQQIHMDAKMTVPLIIDAEGLLAKAFHAKTNAEFLVFDQNGSLVYKGAYYIQKTEEKESGVVSVVDVIESLLNHQSVRPTITRAYGCLIHCSPFVKYENLAFLFLGSQMVDTLKEVE